MEHPIHHSDRNLGSTKSLRISNINGKCSLENPCRVFSYDYATPSGSWLSATRRTFPLTGVTLKWKEGREEKKRNSRNGGKREYDELSLIHEKLLWERDKWAKLKSKEKGEGAQTSREKTQNLKKKRGNTWVKLQRCGEKQCQRKP